MRLLAIMLCLVWAVSCQPSAESTASKDEATEQHDGHDHDGHDHEGHDHGDDADAEGDGIHFGEKIDEEGAMSYDDLLAKLKDDGEAEVKVMGKVEEVCQAKGCWMNIVSDNDPEAGAMFVKFKDYGFFMPKDIAGKTVVMEGKAYWEVTPVEDLRHFAEDAGKSEEEIAAITEPKEELKFMASGVKLLTP